MVKLSIIYVITVGQGLDNRSCNLRDMCGGTKRPPKRPKTSTPTINEIIMELTNGVDIDSINQEIVEDFDTHSTSDKTHSDEEDLDEDEIDFDNEEEVEGFVYCT